MSKQDELLLRELENMLIDYYNEERDEALYHNRMTLRPQEHAKRILAKVKQHYEQKGLDRPELREILREIEWDGRKVLIDNFEEIYAKLLALIPDKEAIEKEWADRLNGCKDACKLSIEEAKREERKRLLNYLKSLAKANPKGSLLATIDLIETTKGEG